MGQHPYPQAWEKRAAVLEMRGDGQQLDDPQPLQMPITLARWEAMKPAEGLDTQPTLRTPWAPPPSPSAYRRLHWL